MSKRDIEKEKEMLLAEQVNAKTLHLRVGQIITVQETMPNGDRKKKKAEIRKLYKNHALCRVIGRFNECYTYNELACIIRRREKNHE